MKENDVLRSAHFVVDNAKHVHINREPLRVFAERLEIPEGTNWLLDSPFNIAGLSDEEKAMFCVVFNATSFSFWGDPYWSVEYNGRLYTRGSWSLVACIFRSIEEGNPNVA